MPLLSIEEALERTLERVRPAKVALRPPEEALELFLAEPLRAPRSLPAADNSAMDGYALRACDTGGATRDRPALLRVTGVVYAGQPPPRGPGKGEAFRIFTGGQLPEGADAVIRQEATKAEEDQLQIFVEAQPGQNIRRRGEELLEGAPLFARGQRVDPYVASLLASSGVQQVPVCPPVAAAVLAVGDELLSPGTRALPHQLYESNSVLMAGLLRPCNVALLSRRRVRDELAQLTCALTDALAEAEVVITCGGASVGDRDLVKTALRELGARFAVDGVALKPGKPVGMATVGDKWVAVLPGNPGAAAVAFDRLVRPLLFALQGVREVRRVVRAGLEEPIHKQPGLTAFLSARLEDGRLRLRRGGAGQLLQNVGLDGWAVLPRGRGEFVPGEQVEVELLQGSTFEPLDAPAGPGNRRPSPFALSLVGWSNTGKTSLLERLIPELARRGLRVAALKHSAHPHPLHPEGSDTARLSAAGAEPVALVTAEGSQWSARADPAAALAALRASPVDLILVEGWKDGPLPKLELRPEGAGPLTSSGVRWVLTPQLAADTAAVADRIVALASEEARYVPPQV